MESSTNHTLVKECILTALVQLLEDTPYEDIKLKDITEKAGVSHMAFYRNYSSKIDILVSHGKELIAEIKENIKGLNPEGNEETYVYFLKCLEDHGKFWSTLLKANASSYFYDLISEITRMHTGLDNCDDNDQRVQLIGMEGAVFSIIKYWVEEEFPFPAEELVAPFKDYYDNEFYLDRQKACNS